MAKQIIDTPRKATISDYERVVRLMDEHISVKELENLIITNRLDYNQVMGGGKTFFSKICNYIGSDKSTEGLDFLKATFKEGKVNINHKDTNNNTVLIDEAKLGHVKVCEILVDSGAEINSLNILGDTPLRNACLNQNFDVTLLLLKKGADATVLNPPPAALTKPSNCYGKLKEMETLCRSKLEAKDVEPRHESVPGLYFIEKLLFDMEGLKKCLSMQQFDELFQQAKDCRIIKHFESDIRKIFEQCKALKSVGACPLQIDPSFAEESFLRSYVIVSQKIDDSSFMLLGDNSSQHQDQGLS